MRKQIIIAFYLILIMSKMSVAQIRDELDIVELDLGLNITKIAVPFDKPFIVKGILLNEAQNVNITYKGKVFNGAFTSNDSKSFEILFNYPLPYNKKDDSYQFNIDYEETIKPEQLKPIREQLNEILFNYINEKSKTTDGVIDPSVTKQFQHNLRNLLKSFLATNDSNFKVKKDSFLDENSNNIQNIFELGDILKDFRNLNSTNNELSRSRKEVNKIFQKYVEKLANYNNKNATILALKVVDGQSIIDILSRGCSDIKIRDKTDCDNLQFGNFLTLQEIKDRIELTNKNISTINKTDFPFPSEDNDVISVYLDQLNRGVKTQESLEKHLLTIVNFLEIIISQSITINTSLSGSMLIRASWYSSADVGVLYAYQQKEFVPFIGMNLYFRPIDKNIPFERLRSAKAQRGETNSLFWYRFSAVVGLTFSGLTKNDDPKFNIVFGRGIISGVGYRLKESLKLNAGVLWFNQKDINPLITQYTLKPTPYISLSLDWDLKSFVSKFF